MWPKTFTDRLRSWVYLRETSVHLTPQAAYLLINDWWLRSPWQPYYLHWDDHRTWPDPWNLLADNVYCDLARAIGITYTLLMARSGEIGQVQICDTDQGNLVSIDDGKYILNWAQGSILNTPSHKFTIRRAIPGASLLLPKDNA